MLIPILQEQAIQNIKPVYAIDVNTVDMTFDGTAESNWLRDNCYKYGFVLRYLKGKENITGYMYEPWHIRYMGKDIATNYIIMVHG